MAAHSCISRKISFHLSANPIRKLLVAAHVRRLEALRRAGIVEREAEVERYFSVARMMVNLDVPSHSGKR